MKAIGITAFCLITFLFISTGGPATAQQSEVFKLTNQAIKLDAAGNRTAAIELAERAVAASEKAFGPTHPNTIQTLINLAVFYSDQGRLTDAERLAKRVLAITERSQGSNSPGAAIALLRLAGICKTAARYSEAEPLLIRALSIREKALGPRHLDVARTLSVLGFVYWIQGRYPAAEQADRRALAIYEKEFGPEHSDVATTVLSLAIVHRDQQRYQEAEPLYKRALAIRERLFGAESATFAEALKALGELYRRGERYDEAEPVLARALAIDEKVLGATHPYVATDCTSLGHLYRDQRRYSEAEPYFKRALAIFQGGSSQVQPDFVATALSNLASIYFLLGRSSEAEPLYKSAMALEEKLLGSENPRIAQTLVNLAVLYREQARYSEAEPLYMRALQITERELGPDYPGLSPILDHLAALYARQDRYGEALPFAKRDIAIGHQSASVILDVLNGAVRDGHIAREAALDDALAIVDQSMQSAAAIAVRKLGIRLAAGNGRLADLVRQEQDLSAEVDQLEKAIVSAIAKERSQRNTAAEQGLKQRLATIVKDRSIVQETIARQFPEHAAFSRPRPLKAKDVQSLLSGNEALIVFAPGRGDTTFVFVLTSDAFDWKVIPISSNGLSQRVSAFRNGLDIDAKAIDRGFVRVDELLNATPAGRPMAFSLGNAHDLYTALLAPVGHLIHSKKDLLIVPFGALTALPFHLLVSEPLATLDERADFDAYRQAAWLIKRYTVSILPSVSSLKILRTAKTPTRSSKPMVGFGDPVFNPNETKVASSRAIATNATMIAQKRSFAGYWKGAGVDRSLLSQALPRLPETADEIEQIAGKLGASRDDIYLRQAANETMLKSLNLSNYRIVYFATHGLVAGDVKGLAEPSLALTIPPQPTAVDDGLLTASEVAQLALNADWIVLSACNTISGDRPGAEALSGLARAFFYAGAKALLVSHWAVESRAAARLATSTFDILQSDPTIGRARALQRAMLSYLSDTSNPQNAYPAFWGPFTVIGEPGGN
ncbi:MAG: tetratricopeptide repeat protein [Bradyrhizobium sp.]|uniref:CHAT domain-containing tetratricopeptide repeat protein n=1 Tax=Bradyrhizobium sp. TaxID=376 RepID=UPI003D13482C